jgi:nicotinamidase-related amidase
MKGRPGTEIDRRIERVTDHVFTKFRGDAFSDPMLDRFLVEHRVGELFLTGVDMDGCVHFTAKGALARGYRVRVVREALGLRAKRKWNKLLDDYQREGITVVSGEAW